MNLKIERTYGVLVGVNRQLQPLPEMEKHTISRGIINVELELRSIDKDKMSIKRDIRDTYGLRGRSLFYMMYHSSDPNAVDTLTTHYEKLDLDHWDYNSENISRYGGHDCHVVLIGIGQGKVPESVKQWASAHHVPDSMSFMVPIMFDSSTQAYRDAIDAGVDAELQANLANDKYKKEQPSIFKYVVSFFSPQKDESEDLKSLLSQRLQERTARQAEEQAKGHAVRTVDEQLVESYFSPKKDKFEGLFRASAAAVAPIPSIALVDLAQANRPTPEEQHIVRLTEEFSRAQLGQIELFIKAEQLTHQLAKSYRVLRESEHGPAIPTYQHGIEGIPDMPVPLYLPLEDPANLKRTYEVEIEAVKADFNKALVLGNHVEEFLVHQIKMTSTINNILEKTISQYSKSLATNKERLSKMLEGERKPNESPPEDLGCGEEGRAHPSP